MLSTATRAGSRLGMAGLLVLLACNALQSAAAEGDTRTLTMHHVHTGEDITITYKRDGHYIASALNKLDWFLRDWRKQKETNMDPRLFDLLWDVYRESGATKPIEIICGYRSPNTNAMLRRRSSGVAKHSQHILGRAIDFFIPGVSLAKLRALGLHLEWGGVGYYPTSGSPFVHMDVGLVRHWPSIARKDLRKIFPDGRTVHIPSDGKPLRNYAAALAAVERRGNAPNQRSLDAARAAGLITAGQVRVAEMVAAHPRGPRTLLASLTGSGDNAHGADSMAAPVSSHQARPLLRKAPLRLASLSAPTEVAAKPARHSKAVPLPLARPKTIMTAHAKRKPIAAPVRVAALARIKAESHDIWGDFVASGGGTPFYVAAADPTAIGSAEALAYAAESDPTRVKRVRPMGAIVPPPPAATVIPTGGNATIAMKPPMNSGDARSGSPWLRAAMLTPSVSEYMTASRLTRFDPKWLHALLHKPEQAVMVNFSADPSFGMVTDHFAGHAVVFVATATFMPPTQLSLR